MRLIRLALENFKGIESYDFRPEGQNTTICGTNGVGKTTIFDAYCWLLFDKDGRGHSNFDILPYDQPDALVSVTAELDLGADGGITLQRTFCQKIVRQRGTDEESVKSEYCFYVDGVPKKKTQYAAVIEEICSPDTFMMVSDPDYFAGRMDWKDRRLMLINLFGGVSDAELLADPEWAELSEAASGRKIEDYRAVAAMERKAIKKELDALPDRIDEATAAIPEGVGQQDDDELLAEALAEVNQIEKARNAILDGSEAAEIKRIIAEKQADMAEAKADYLDSIASGRSGTLKAVELARQQCRRAEDNLRQIDARLTDVADSITRKQDLLAELRTDYIRINAWTWNSSDEFCPCCGQQLPADKVEQMRAEFNEKKAKSLEANVAKGKAQKEELAALVRGQSKMTSEREEAQTERDRLAEQLEAVAKDAASIPAYETTNDYVSRTSELGELAEKLRAVESDARARADEYVEPIKTAEEKVRSIRERIAAAQLAARQRERIEDLRAKGRKLGKRAAELDRLLGLAAKFEQYRLSAIEDSINSHFELAKFKLFDRQINGGYAECCEVTVGGAPYSTNLNSGMKINAGLDIIRTLSRRVGVSAPVWIDNAESCVELLDIDAQVIALRVDEDAKALSYEI